MFKPAIFPIVCTELVWCGQVRLFCCKELTQKSLPRNITRCISCLSECQCQNLCGASVSRFLSLNAGFWLLWHSHLSFCSQTMGAMWPQSKKRDTLWSAAFSNVQDINMEQGCVHVKQFLCHGSKCRHSECTVSNANYHWSLHGGNQITAVIHLGFLLSTLENVPNVYK